MTESEILFRRITLMHAKAESARELGNEAEAFAFASAVQKLLLRHNLEMSDVEAAQEEKADPVKMHYFHPEEFGLPPSKARVAWTENLARVVAQAHMCKVIPTRGSNRISLIGTRQNRQICEFMIVTLTRYAATHSEKDYVKFFYECRDAGNVGMARGYKAGWLKGFVGRLAERYQDEMKKVKADPTNSHALIRLDKQLVRLDSAFDQILKGLQTRKAQPPQGRQASDSGINDGVGHADKISLNGSGLGKAGDRRQVGEGQRRLGSGL